MASIVTGNVPSPQSSDFSESSSSSYHEHEVSNSPTRSPDSTTEDTFGGPYLQILEEPYDKFRFRYKTEMQGTHGNILGASGQRKTFPKVKLCNYTPNKGDKDPIIRCTLYSVHEDESKRVAHVHRLIGKDSGGEKEDPHDITVFGPSYTAVFKNMTILFTKKEDQEKVLIEKKQSHIYRRFTNSSTFKRVLDVDKLRSKVLEELSNINRNVACLRFEALMDNGQGMYTSLCLPVYSKPINNMKNPHTNELRICRVDRCAGSCLGGEEVFMFVEKVVKKNIKVKFYEEGPNKEIVWSDYASFTPDDVHHQYGIVFRTPPYRDPNMTNDVEVYFQLERPSDKAVSDPMIFEYHPDRNRRKDMLRKRPRQDSTSNLPTMLNDFLEKPRTWNREPVKHNHTPVADSLDVSSAFNNLCENMDDFSDIIRDILQNPMDLEEGPTEGISSLTSSDWSFDKAFENIPSADNEAVTQFLNSGRFYEYATLNGGEEAAQMLMQVPRDLVMDGICKLNSTIAQSSQKSSGLNPHQDPVDKNIEKDNGDLTNKNNTQTDNGNLISAKNVRRTPKLVLNERNIVEKTEKGLNDLLKLRQTRKLKGQLLQTFLKRLFSYTVGETEDSVFHVLAASKGNMVPLQAERFTNVLKIFSVIESVIDRPNSSQETPLHVAVTRGSMEMVSFLLDAGAKVDATDKMHNTAMHLAVLRETRSKDFVALLLNKDPTLTMYNVDGYNVFHLAVLKRKPDVLSSLLMKADDMVCTEDLAKTRDRKRGNTALHLAVEHRFKEVVQLLLNLNDKIDVNAKNFEDKTPLAFVYEENDSDSKEIADQLLKNKADPTLVPTGDKKEDYKNDYEVEPDLEIIDDFVDESESAYAREWADDGELFDKATISKLCPLLDNNDDWICLFKRLDFTDSEMDFCKIHWSPSLCAFKMAVLKKPEVTAELVRDHLFKLSPHLRCGAQYIDDMLLQKLGLN